MKIPDEVLKNWTALRSYGDFKKIVDKNEGVTQNDITRAFKNRECSDTVFVAIAGFYKDREEAIREYMPVQGSAQNSKMQTPANPAA